MKKWIAVLLAVMTLVSLAACSNTEEKKEEKIPAPVVEGAMTYEEYMAAEVDTKVTVACCVQGHQSWWDNKITVYAADEKGAYFLYELACSEEDSKKLTPGTMIKVTGDKTVWEGEVEIMNGTFEFVDTKYTYIAPAVDLTDKMASDELIKFQNQLATFKGLTVKEVSFKNEGGDDIYVTVTKDDKEYTFCVEIYLTGEDTEVYKTASALKAGDKVDITGYLYWYSTMNPHVTAIKVN